jgi:hypothetical protein
LPRAVDIWAHVARDLRAEGDVAALAAGVEGQQIVTLRGSVQALVVRHPAGQLAELGRDLEQTAGDPGRVVVAEGFGHGVELPGYGLPAQPSRAGGIPSAEYDN